MTSAAIQSKAGAGSGTHSEGSEKSLTIVELSGPPGLLAEYGYVLYKRGEAKSAIEYFEREVTEWPESEALMKRIIERAKKGSDS